MNDLPDSAHPDFWNSRYVSGKTPWDFHGVPGALREFLAASNGGGTVLVPGCGSGYELKAFNDAGFDVIAIDFSAAAVERSRQQLREKPHAVIYGDFFTHDFASRQFELVYERTFLCSLPPARWPAYVERITQLLPRGARLVGFFLYGEEEEPPPYPLTLKQAHGLFDAQFRLARDETVSDSLPLFAGNERWQEWVRR